MRIPRHCLIAAAASLAVAQSGYAVIGFDVPTGDYHVATNWAEFVTGDPTSNYSGAQIAPSQSQDVRIANGGTATVRAGHTADEGGANQFEIAYAANTTGTLVIDPAARFAPRFDIRIGGNSSTDASTSMRTGTLTNNGGVMTGSNLILGFGRSSAGTFNMNGGSLTLDNLTTSNTFLYVGSRARTDTNASSSATVNHTAGDILVTDDVADRVDLAVVRLGNTGAGAGRTAGPTLYDMSGGTLNTPNLQFGSHDTGAGNNTFKLRGDAALTTRRITVLNPTATNTLEFNGGTLKPAISNPTFMQGLTTAKVMAGGAKFDTNGFDVTVAQPLITDPAGTGPDGGLTKSGAGTLTLTGANTYNGGTNVQAGTLQVTRLHENNVVNIAAGAKLQVLDSSPTLPNHPSGDNAFVSRPSSLTIAAGGQLDLGNNDLIIDYTDTSPLEQIEDMIASGFNGGEWNGSGIISTTALNDPNFVLAVAENALLLQPFGDGVGDDPLFAGQVVDDTTVLVKFTHRVDLDLDGLITGNDAAVFNAFYSEGQPATWQFGDLDYDGVYSGNDAAIFNGFYNESLASVPEPAGLALAACGLALLARRHRRSTQK